MNVVEVAQALALGELGHQVEIVTRRSDDQTPAVVEIAPNVQVRHLVAGPTEPLAKSAQEEWIGAFADAMVADLEPYDIVHSHHWMSGVAALRAAQQWGVPHVQSFHSVAALPHRPLGEGEPPESPGRVEGERVIAQESDLVVAVSHAEARTIIDRCGADSKRVVVVHPGVDTDLFRPEGSCECHEPGDPHRPWRPELNGEDEPKQFGPCIKSNPNGYVLFAARLQPLKAPDLAMMTVAGVPAELRPTLVIAGETSQDFQGYRDELVDLAANLGINDRVCWLGSQSRNDLARLVRGARVVMVPSYSETFGLIALEANAAGVPVLAEAEGGLVEAVQDGVTAVLLKSREAEAWSAALTDLMRDPSQLEAMGQAARRRALGFSWERAAEQLDSHYRRLLGIESPAAAAPENGTFGS